MSRRGHYVNKIRQEAEESATRAFRDHVIVVESPDRFLFARPGTGMYSFRVVTGPNMLMMYGDVGELIFLPYGGNSLGWLRGCMDYPYGKHDVSYLASKVPADMKITEYQQELVDQYVAELRAEARDLRECDDDDDGPDYSDLVRAQDIEQTIDEIEDLDIATTDIFYKTLSDSRLDIDEYPTVEGLTFHTMFQMAGLYHFCKAFDRMQPT